MKKLTRFVSEHILFILSIFFLAFIPLYPKLPILDVAHTWVYIRIEDFLVAVAGILFLIQLFRKRATLKTPLTVPILVFLLVGLISTVHAIFFIFPDLANVFPTVAVLHYLRRVEYLSLFFIGYSAMKQKSFTNIVAGVLVVTLILVVLYGLGQKGLLVGWENRFPAFSTMNEEFAKGIPLQISALGRVSSTFAGHYDLAAYLVMMIPLMGAFIFGYKKLYLKALFLLAGVGGLVLLLLTSSRVSFAVYLLTIMFLIFLQRIRFLTKVILIVVVTVASILLMNTQQGISDRFASTISQVDVVVDARTGKPVGIATTEADGTGKKIVIEDKTPTGENLPQGSGYINIPGGDAGDSVSEVTYRKKQLSADGEVTEVTELEGDFVIKKVLAYDLSFTTRFQGTWPRAFEAFQRNYFLGSGYSAISLATDNNYLRILGEVGLLGLFSYLGIFLIFGVYLKKVISSVDDKNSYALITGVSAALFGVGLNAVLIDVFEASKVAFVMWLLVGLCIGLAHLYQKEKINYRKEITKVFLSIPAIIVYMLLLLLGVYGSSISHFFIGDDFTWLRWAADCKEVLFTDGTTRCEPTMATITRYVTDAEGFFYRPGTKTYFYLMYPFFSLSQYAYHVVSLAIHFTVSVVVLLLSYKILRSKLFAVITAVLFVVLSAHAEAVLWVSATGHLVAFGSMLLSLLLFIYWRQTKILLFLPFSILFAAVSPLFHEIGIVTPILIIGYDLIMNFSEIKSWVFGRWFYVFYVVLIPVYLYLRDMAGAHVSGGDYSYNFIKLPFNVVGNLIGYIFLTFGGTHSYPLYESLRIFGREHTSTIWITSLVIVFLFAIFYWLKFRFVSKNTKRMLLVILLLFVVPLLPFLGLGNIAYRYDYFASFALLLFAAFILMRVHQKISPLGKRLSLVIILIPVLVFGIFQVVELERVKEDWQRAGAKTEEILITFNQVYAITRGFAPNPVFYFVNTPIRTGDAWIFPVGLGDALWFTFQNENLTVFEVPTLDMAFDVSEGSVSAKVFEFDKEGNISEVTKQVPKEE